MWEGVFDIYCDRGQGNNDADEPSFTQPLMYRAIGQHPTTREIYARKLVEEGLMQEGEAAGMSAAFRERLETEFDASKSYKPNKADWREGAWSGLSAARGEDRRGNTAASLGRPRGAGAGITRVQDACNPDRTIARQPDSEPA